jgi:putative selenium metabolism hydrolase
MANLLIDPTHFSAPLLAFTQALVRTQSYSGQEGPLARLITEQMRALDFDEVRIDAYGSVIGRVGHGEKSILFDGHMDTVTVMDADLWQRPPFGGEIAEGYLWGRGSVDMKSGLAAAVYAAARAKRQGLLEGKSVIVTCSVDEEYCDGEGLRHAMETLPKPPDFAVICEPSENVIALGHKGKAQVRIRTQGVSAHGSAPEKGINAVYEMAEIIQRVERTNQALMSQGGSHGTLVLSQISSESVSLNAVPPACEIYLDRRMAPGETEATVRAEMDAIIAGKRASWELDTLRRSTWTGEQLVYQPLHPAWEIRKEEALARAFIAAYGETFGHAPEQYDFWDFSTDAVASVRLGIPTIGFGPGEYKLAHMRDERCATQQIVDACEVYTQVISKI